jgi:hypothetical protein
MMQETLCKYVYSPEALAAAEAAIRAQFGPVGHVLREVISPELRADLCVVAPQPGRPWQTVVTLGMGAYPMQLPPELCAQESERVELALMLPPEWDLAGRDECLYWPLRWLKLLARLPAEEASWLGWGHTIPNGEPFAENTDFSAVLLLDAQEAPPAEPRRYPLPGGNTLRFYRLFPLYEEELQYKLQFGTQALLRLFGDAPPLPLDLARPSACPAARPQGGKQFRIEKHRLRPLLPDWDEPGGCLATDRILVDGAKVGYCYREAPCGEWDSGWRFTAGDESDEYMDAPAHSGVYSLNLLANYDAEILPLLRAPAPCAFTRGAQGLEPLKNLTGR